MRDPISEAVANVREARLPALVLDGVMQESSYSHILGTTIFEDCCGNCEKVCDIRGRRSLADLAAMNVCCV